MLFLSSRRVNAFLCGCSLEVEFRKYRFKHPCTCSPCGCGVRLFFRCRYGFHNFVQDKVYVLSFGVRRIGFRKFKRASRSMRLRFRFGGPFGDFSAFFFDLVFILVSGLVLGAFWDAFGTQNGAQNRSQDGQKGVLEPTSENIRK